MFSIKDTNILLSSKIKNSYLFTKNYCMKKIIVTISTLCIFLYTPFPLISYANWGNWSEKQNLTKLIQNISTKDPNKMKSEWIIKKNNWHYVVEQNHYNMNMDIDTVEKKITFRKKWVSFQIGMPIKKWEGTTETIDGQIISSSNSVNIITQAVDGGVRQIININSNDANKYYDFPLLLPSKYTLAMSESGSVNILDAEWKIYTMILTPWAKDANGSNIPTRYTIEPNNTIRQYIDFDENSKFPIIADPVWCGALISYTNWLYRWWNHPWSLSIEPTACWRVVMSSYSASFVSILFQQFGWSETLEKTPVSVHWDKSPWTSIYNSMYNQFICHAQYVLLKDKWNLEPTRADVGYLGTVWALCNP